MDGDGAGSPPARRRRASSSDWRLKVGFLCPAQLLLALARLRRLTFAPLARLALATYFGLAFLTTTVLLLARPRVEERPCSGFALLGGQRRQDDTRLGRRRRGRLPRGGRRRPPRGDGNGRLGGGSGRSGRWYCGLAWSQDATLHLLDDDRLAAPVRKALPNGALLDRALQMKCRFRRLSACRFVSVARFVHACS